MLGAPNEEGSLWAPFLLRASDVCARYSAALVGSMGNFGVPASMRSRLEARPRRRLRMRRRALVMVVLDGMISPASLGADF
jgi:hypothetical protein